MAKKKKMSKAQAASARKDKTAVEISRDRTKKHARQVREDNQKKREEAKESSGSHLVIIVAVVALLIVFAAVFTLLPGVIMGGH